MIRPRAYGVVVIGRNEGDRLKRCLTSIPLEALTVYVDSGSTDGSVEWAKIRGTEVVEMDLNISFTAGRARNAGFARLRELAPQIDYVQFVDGDCELRHDWPQIAIDFLNAHDDVCAAFGRRRERYPERSVFNRLCDQEWNVPIGRAFACGGDVMMRVLAFEKAQGFRNDIIAGEEPELCVRLRAHGWSICRIDHEMTLHDANITQFSQWWQRTVRSGYAFAQGAQIHGGRPEQHWVWESRRIVIWSLLIPLLCIGAVLAFGPWGIATFLIYPLQILRRFRRLSGSFLFRLQFASFELLGRFPEGLGQLKFARDRMRGRAGQLIEYK